MPINKESEKLNTKKTNDKDNQQYWYVMLHLEPSTISRLLLIENEERTSKGLPALTHVIPYQYLKRAPVDTELQEKQKKTRKEKKKLKEIEDNNSLRSQLHEFVFVQATESEIRELVNRPWNRNGRLHLHYYRTHEGHPIRINDAEMKPLIELFVRQHRRFTLVPFQDGLPFSETVRIKKGLFSGSQATIMEIIYKKNGIHLTLGIPVFNNEQTLKLYDYRPNDVEVSGQGRFFEHFFLRNVEADLLDILRRRVMHRDTPEYRVADQDKLNKYSLLQYMKFDDDVLFLRSQALMLLSASLRKDYHTRDLLVPELLNLLPNPDEPRTDEEAFLLAVIFEATRKGEYRKTAKTYCQQHETIAEPLGQLMTLVKRIVLR